jgi:cytidylate kinase
MSLVVISREMGSGGTQVGKAVAERLGYRFVDREVILEAARRYEVREEKLARLEESKPTIWERFDRDRELYLVFLQAALYSFAVEDNTVIAGRAAPLLLQGIAHALRVRMTAPLAVRAARVAEEEHLTPAEAEARVKRYDEESAARLTSLFHTDCASPVHYDLVLNTERGTLESLSQIIVQTARLELFQPTPASLRTLQDLSLAAQVRAALLRTPGLNTLDIRVRAAGGAVFLEGAVFGPHWAELATRTAKTVRGVDAVTCQTSEDPLLYTPPPRV